MPADEIKRIPLLFNEPTEESIDSPLDRRSETYRHIAQKFKTEHPLPAQQKQKIMTIPNILTFARLIFVPVLIGMWEWNTKYAPLWCSIVFITASLTDWADGYLARKLKITTTFGAFLDPVADKVMVSTTLILLVTSPPLPISRGAMVLPSIIMICREITMSALREWAAAAGGAAQKAVKVNSFGKWKTAFQMVAMSVLLVVRQPLKDLQFLFPASLAYLADGPYFLYLSEVAFVFLWLATALAVWSLGIYMSNVWTHFLYPQQKKAE
eukprot:gene9091-16215_t